MSYKDIKVTENGGFFVKSKDLFKNKKEVLERLERLQALLNKIKTNRNYEKSSKIFKNKR